MNGRAIGIVYRKELRDSLRDRRAIISMIVVPVLAIPLLMFGIGILMFKTMTHARQEVPQVMIIGGENSPKVLSALHAAKNIQIVPTTGDFTNQLMEKRIRAAVKLPPDFDSTIPTPLARGSFRTKRKNPIEPPMPWIHRCRPQAWHSWIFHYKPLISNAGILAQLEKLC